MKTIVILSTLLSSQVLFATAKVDRLVSRHYVEEESELVRRDAGFSNGGSEAIAGKDELGNLKNKDNFLLSLYHVNDIHARLDQFRPSGSLCTDPKAGCVGGYPRIKSVVESRRRLGKNSLFLHAGDEFQGTLFHTLYRGEASASIMNQMSFDAMTLGNHEWDEGDDVLAQFLSNLTFPVISANVKTTHTALARNIIPYQIFSTGQYRGMDVAVVAVTTETTKMISRPGEGTTFEDPVEAVKRTVATIKRKHRNIKRIIALTHLGYEQDIRLAQATTDIDIIVGGHSHTLLADNATVPAAQGPYPTIAINPRGEEVFVVTSYRWGEYLGFIDLEFDRQGRIVRYEGAPIHLNNLVPATRPENSKLKAEVNRWAQGFAAFAAKIVGRTTTALDITPCQGFECNMGNLAADALAGMSPSNFSSPHNNRTGTPPAGAPPFAGALINAGGLRSSIDAGDISLLEVLQVFPFGNTVVDLPFTSAQLWNVFESIVGQQNVEDPTIRVTGFVQVSSSIRFSFNFAQPPGSRLVNLTVANGQPVVRGDTSTMWTVATIDFLAFGGDGFWPPRSPTEVVTLEAFENVFIEYLASIGRLQGTPDGLADVTIGLDGRISRVTA